MNTMRQIKVVDPTDVLWKRIGAWLLDVGIYSVLVWIAGRILPGIFGSVFMVLFAIALWAAMFVVMQGITGASPGKEMVGLRVVTADGEPCGVHRALVRTLWWVVDGFPYVLPLTGYAAAFGDKDGQRIGDRRAGTYVVDHKYLGQPPFSVAFPADGSAPYRLDTRAPYLAETHINPINHKSSEPAALNGAPSDPSPRKPGSEPVFDADLKGYKRWDAVHNTWAVFDEPTRQWKPAAVSAPTK